MASVVVPVKVRVWPAASSVPVINVVLAKPRMSWPAAKLPVIATVAPTRVVPSTSVGVRPGSMAVAAWFSV